MKDENLEGVSKQDLTNCKLQDFATGDNNIAVPNIFISLS